MSNMPNADPRCIRESRCRCSLPTLGKVGIPNLQRGYLGRRGQGSGLSPGVSQHRDPAHAGGSNTPDAACMETFLKNKVPLAWRRPVAADEIAGIMALFNARLGDQHRARGEKSRRARCSIRDRFCIEPRLAKMPPRAPPSRSLSPRTSSTSAVNFASGYGSRPGAESEGG